jgi:calcineurin-like phosphoesterase family protein
MSYWFTADPHFDHTNVIKYANRPFRTSTGEPDVELMNEQLVERWNAQVGLNDHVYLIGDFYLGKKMERAIQFVQSLNGIKYLVFGNHDKMLRRNKAFLDNFVWAKDFAEIKIPDPDAGGAQVITLCHYAMKVWNKSHYGAWQLYGHSHGSLPDDPHRRQADVGVDNWNYTPVSYEQLKEYMRTKIWKPIDHHGAHDI